MKAPHDERCWCGAAIEHASTGRRRHFCSDACRVARYRVNKEIRDEEERRRAEAERVEARLHLLTTVIDDALRIAGACTSNKARISAAKQAARAVMLRADQGRMF